MRNLKQRDISEDQRPPPRFFRAKSRISAGQTISMADNLMEKQQKQRGRG
jgi:hypothetical protein